MLGIRVRMLFGVGLLAATGGLSVHAQVSVTTWHNDIARTGQNLNETILNTSNVNATQFGLLFSQPVDGYVYAQPLYLPNLTIGGASHNVVFIATEHDSVYAFDADNNAGANANPLWLASLLAPEHGAAAGATTIPANVGSDIYPEMGITGTPVIDPLSGTLYVVSWTLEGTNYVQRLHALDVTSGAEKFGCPVVISATIPGIGNGSVNSTLTFDSEWELQRAGLLLLNGIVYIGFGSVQDAGPWHGWILGYNAATLQQTGVFCTTPNGVGGGVWMSGAGLAAEVNDPAGHPFGRMFVPTGNGDYTATAPYGPGMDYGDTVLSLDLTNGAPTVQDEFTPMNQAAMDALDGDLASSGLMILPAQTMGSAPNLIVQGAKSGELYLLNRDNLGGYNPAGDTVVQEFKNSASAWSTAAYWKGNVYYWGVKDTLKMLPVVNGQLTGPTAISSETYGFPGATPSISANGNTQGIVWTIDAEAYRTGGPALLQAHEAANPATTLYSSNTNASRDNPGNAVKFTVPTVANGKVYVGAQYQLSVFGLLGAQQTAASPQLSPGAESFSGSLTVNMTDATAGAKIYYTPDGSTPTVSSKVYSTPITITATTTIQAMAAAPGYLQSSVSSETYTGLSQASAPTFSPAGATYTTSQSVAIADATSGATIYYTTDGTTPTTSSAQYSGAISVSTTETIEAIAAAVGYSASSVSSATYTITPPAATPTFSPAAGTYASTQSVSITDATSGATIYYTTDGTTPTASSTPYTSAITVASTETLEAIAVARGYSQSALASAPYIINLPTPGFIVSGTSVTMSASAATVNTTSIVTVTPVGGFTGSVALTAAITSSPNGAQNLPTLSFGSTTPVSITSATATTATLTITAAPASSAKTTTPKRLGVPWFASGSATLGFLLLFGVPSRRRCRRAMLGEMLLLLGTLCGGLLACSDGVTGSGLGGGTIYATTPGAYTVTVTGKSGATTETGTIALTVQ
jgi:hypothetical protein